MFSDVRLTCLLSCPIKVFSRCPKTQSSIENRLPLQNNIDFSSLLWVSLSLSLAWHGFCGTVQQKWRYQRLIWANWKGWLVVFRCNVSISQAWPLLQSKLLLSAGRSERHQSYQAAHNTTNLLCFISWEHNSPFQTHLLTTQSKKSEFK